MCLFAFYEVNPRLVDRRRRLNVTFFFQNVYGSTLDC